MSYTTPDFADTVVELLTGDGYQVHELADDATRDRGGVAGYYWTLALPGLDIETGEDRDTEHEAWASALAHRLHESKIPTHKGGKHPAPESMRTLLQRRVAWEVSDAPDGAELQRMIEDAAALLEHGDAALPAVVRLELTISDQTCWDIMCTASEGGINYWADIIKRKGQAREDSGIPDIISFEADIIDGPVQCDHPDTPAAEIGRFTCDPTMIRQGIARLLAPGALVSPAIRNDVLLQAADPEHACDADSADSIVQFGVFGELVFG